MSSVPIPPKSQRYNKWDGIEHRKQHRILWQEGEKVFYYKEEFIEGHELKMKDKRRSYRKEDYD